MPTFQQRAVPPHRPRQGRSCARTHLRRYPPTVAVTRPAWCYPCLTPAVYPKILRYPCVAPSRNVSGCRRRTTRCSTLPSDEHAPQAQRVTGCAAPQRGLALTQRRDTHARSPYVGNLRADLPSGEQLVPVLAYTVHHTVADGLLNNDGDPITVQTLLDHANVQTTALIAVMSGRTRKWWDAQCVVSTTKSLIIGMTH